MAKRKVKGSSRVLRLAFKVGDHDDFEQEVAAARRNKRLMAFLDRRAKEARGKSGTSIEQVRKDLDL